MYKSLLREHFFERGEADAGGKCLDADLQLVRGGIGGRKAQIGVARILAVRSEERRVGKV